MTSVVVTDAVARPPARARTKPAFYVGIAFFMVGLVVVGFWPTYFGRLVRGDIARPLVVQIHGLVFVGWMALLVAQIVLAWRGRVQMHRRVGRWGIAYGILVLVMGVIIGIAAPVMHVHAGDWTRDRAAGFLLITFGDMVLFGSLFGAAIMYRRTPEIHKRLMLAATVALLFAAIGRMQFLDPWPSVQTVVWLSPLLVGMLYDWRARGRPHVAYVISAAWLFVGAMRVLLTESEGWLRIGRAILAAFV
jgi:uncharacterized membrane protein YozB (DUF420 family)